MQYVTGTVNVINANSTVIGVGTLWKANVSNNDLFIVSGDTVSYQVANVVSNTQITLSATYAGTNANGSNYTIARDFTPIRGLPIINRGDVETAVLWKRMVQIIDGLL
jgi:hypothetical protein